MSLKDYSTYKVPEQTITEISMLLKDFGVRGILSEYDDTGNIVAVSFKIRIGEDDYGYKLPTDWRPVLKALENDRRVPKHKCTEDQARRTAWRQIYHWIDAQLALIKVKMVKLEIVFLPYMVTSSGETVGEKFEKRPQFLIE